MGRIGYSVSAALIIALAACKAQQPDTENQLSANEAQKVDKKATPAADAAGAKCPNLYTQLPPQTPDLTRKVYSCVERYALLYAKGPDSPEALSKAVMAKCKYVIVPYVDAEAKKAGVKAPYKEAFESWQAHTLPLIAEARARRCYG